MFGLDETFTLQEAQKRIKERAGIILTINVCGQDWVGYVVNQDGAYLSILLEMYEYKVGAEPHDYIISGLPSKHETPTAAFQALNEAISCELDDLHAVESI